MIHEMPNLMFSLSFIYHIDYFRRIIEFSIQGHNVVECWKT